MILDEFISDILDKEGGYVDNPNDSGGPTNYGITQRVAAKYGYKGSMRTIPMSLVKQILKEKYWDELSLDAISALSPSVAYILGDIGVNMGTQRAAEFLQRTLNVMNQRGKIYPDVVVDGDIGNQTLNALKVFLNHRKSQGELVMTRALTCLQGAFYINLAERRPKDEDFVYGWILNRVV
jgi:lysozyme family protein